MITTITDAKTDPIIIPVLLGPAVVGVVVVIISTNKGQ